MTRTCCISALVFLCSCIEVSNQYGKSLSTTNVKPAHLAEFETESKLQLPAQGITPLGFVRSVGLDDVWYLKIRLQSQELDDFLKMNSGVIGQRMQGARPVLTLDKSWWTLDGLSNVEEAESSVGPGKYLRVIIGQEKTGEYVLLLKCFET